MEECEKSKGREDRRIVGILASGWRYNVWCTVTSKKMPRWKDRLCGDYTRIDIWYLIGRLENRAVQLTCQFNRKLAQACNPFVGGHRARVTVPRLTQSRYPFSHAVSTKLHATPRQQLITCNCISHHGGKLHLLNEFTTWKSLSPLQTNSTLTTCTT